MTGFGSVQKSRGWILSTVFLRRILIDSCSCLHASRIKLCQNFKSGSLSLAGGLGTARGQLPSGNDGKWHLPPFTQQGAAGISLRSLHAGRKAKLGAGKPPGIDDLAEYRLQSAPALLLASALLKFVIELLVMQAMQRSYAQLAATDSMLRRYPEAQYQSIALADSSLEIIFGRLQLEAVACCDSKSYQQGHRVRKEDSRAFSSQDNSIGRKHLTCTLAVCHLEWMYWLRIFAQGSASYRRLCVQPRRRCQ